jgi:hypothetical protein
VHVDFVVKDQKALTGGFGFFGAEEFCQMDFDLSLAWSSDEIHGLDLL